MSRATFRGLQPGPRSLKRVGSGRRLHHCRCIRITSLTGFVKLGRLYKGEQGDDGGGERRDSAGDRLERNATGSRRSGYVAGGREATRKGRMRTRQTHAGFVKFAQQAGAGPQIAAAGTRRENAANRKPRRRHVTARNGRPRETVTINAPEKSTEPRARMRMAMPCDMQNRQMQPLHLCSKKRKSGVRSAGWGRKRQRKEKTREVRWKTECEK